MTYFLAALVGFLLAILVSRTNSLWWSVPCFAFIIFAPDLIRALIVALILLISFFLGIAIDVRVKPHPPVLTAAQVAKRKHEYKLSQWPYVHTFRCCNCFYRFRIKEHDMFERDGDMLLYLCENCGEICLFRKPTWWDIFLGNE